MHSGWRSLLVLFALWLGWQGGQAQPRAVTHPPVLIVSSGTEAAYSDAAQNLIASLERAGVSRYDIRQISASDLSASKASAAASAPRVIVALGTAAALALAQSSQSAPVLNVLLPRASFERVLRSTGRNSSSLFSAIYLDQPLARQLSLIRLALPKARHLGVLWGPDSWPKATELRAQAAANALVLHEAGVEGHFDLFPDLQQVLNGSEVLLAIADPLVFNSSSIQHILLSAFRAKVPLVAFSPAYVRAGALLSLQTTPAQAGLQAADWVAWVLNNKPLPAKPIEPNDFEVSVNAEVARVFNLALDGAALRLELRRLERLP